MSIRKLATLTAVAAVALFAIGAGSASASTALRLDPGNTLFSGATTITNTTSSSATWTQSIGVITCANTKFEATVNSHSSATTITGTLNQLTFTSCTDTIPVINFTSCHLVPNATTGLLPTIHINATNDIGGIQDWTDPTLRCNVGLPTSFCYYTASVMTGVGSNVASTLSFNVSTLIPVAGSGSLGAACGSAGTPGSFAVTLNHSVQVGANKTVTVTTS